MLSKIDLTQGGITGTLLRFTLPMIIGSLLQQCYNIADTLIVGQCIGSGALAAVGSAYTLMVFLISILLGLSMGSGTVFSLQYGAGQTDSLRRSIYVSVLLIGTVTLILNIAVFVWIHPILRILQIPKDIYGMMYDYLWIIFWGIGFTFIYNFYAALLRAIGNAVTPLCFLAISVVLNIGLDLFFILLLDWGIKGAAIATVAAQGVSALGIMGYAYVKYPELRLHRNDLHFDRHCLKEITSFSALTCVQQSVMNLGILMVQGLVNSFGTVVMAAFAAAIKIDDRGKIFYKQKRLTMNAKEFYVYKFRSMIPDAEKDGIPRLASNSDSRITRVGKFLRKCRLDEIPQLINILRGDMSVVGPRPERPELTEKYEKEMPEFRFRLKVKAGLTGYAQVTGVYDTTPYDKLKMDLMYIERYSMVMDLRLILMTLKTIIFPGEMNSNEKNK